MHFNLLLRRCPHDYFREKVLLLLATLIDLSFYDGAVAIDGTQIVDIGTYDELCKAYVNAEIIDAHNGLIMPGFINAHHHIYSALARGLSLPGPAPTNFGEILEGFMVLFR